MAVRAKQRLSVRKESGGYGALLAAFRRRGRNFRSDSKMLRVSLSKRLDLLVLLYPSRKASRLAGGCVRFSCVCFARSLLGFSPLFSPRSHRSQRYHCPQRLFRTKACLPPLCLLYSVSAARLCGTHLRISRYNPFSPCPSFPGALSLIRRPFLVSSRRLPAGPSFLSRRMCNRNFGYSRLILTTAADLPIATKKLWCLTFPC